MSDFKATFVKKEMFKVNLNTIDIIAGKPRVSELADISISNLANNNILVYNSVLATWQNKRMIYKDDAYDCLMVDL